MTPTPLPGLDLDLDYPAADPAVRLAERAIQAGRRRRRRNRLGAVVAALLLLSVGAAGSWRVAAGPAASVQVAASSDLPASVGHGPDRETFVDPAYRGPLDGSAGPQAATAYPDRFVDIGPAEGSRRAVVYQTRDGWFCFGSQRTQGAAPESSACRLIDQLPAEGIWVGMASITSTLSPEATVITSGNPLPLSLQAGPGQVLVVGVVRGEVSRVTVDLLGRSSLPTRLLPAPNPRLGTVYVAAVDADQYRAAVDAIPPQESVALRTAVPLGVTVYRGDRAVFHCDSTSCPSP